jgi:hypothetical protein
VREPGGVGPWQRKGRECRTTAAGGDSPRLARFRTTYHTTFCGDEAMQLVFMACRACTCLTSRVGRNGKPSWAPLVGRRGRRNGRCLTMGARARDQLSRRSKNCHALYHHQPRLALVAYYTTPPGVQQLEDTLSLSLLYALPQNDLLVSCRVDSPLPYNCACVDQTVDQASTVTSYIDHPVT